MLRTLFAALLLIHKFRNALIEAQVPFAEFYPYGPSAGDLVMPNQLDTTRTISIQFEFPFFDSTFREIHISSNGIFSFGSGDSAWIPRPFPLVGRRSVASYWTDTDPRRGGNIFYRDTDLPSLLNRVTDEIRTRFVQYNSFTSRWALVVTFDRVPAYGCASFPQSCSTHCNDTLTYQTILTSNGMQSFAILNFNSLKYTAGTDACQGHAQVGFNAGDGKRFYLLPDSNTPNIKNVALTGSNVGVPGKWMFTIDGSDIAEGCNDRGLLEIYPRKLLYFGNQNITISGPCFNGTQTTISVRIGNDKIMCNVSNAQQIQCVAPLLNKMGNNDVRLMYNNISYKSFVVVVDVHNDIVADGQIEARDSTDLNSEFTLRWQISTDCPSNEPITFNGFQIDSVMDSSGEIIAEEIFDLYYPNIPNTGSCNLLPKHVNRPATVSFIRHVYLAGYCNDISLKQVSPKASIDLKNMKKQLFESAQKIIFKSKSAVAELHPCNLWYRVQPNAAEMKKIVDKISVENPCPPGVERNFPAIIGNFEEDENCNPRKPGACAYYHNGAKGCYRSTRTVDGIVTQCCYDENGQLLLGPPGGGTIDFGNSNDGLWGLSKHVWKDVFPYVYCSKMGLDLIDKYYEKRPSIDSRFFLIPGNGNGNGDPHYTTLDGTSYTFNTVGEFVYLRAANDIIQARITQYEDGQGNKKPACYFSAYVVKSDQSDTVQVEINSVKLFTFRINGQTMGFDYGQWSFNDISMNYINSSTVVLQTTTSINLEVRIIGGVLNAIVSLPGSAKGTVSGLVGNWDDSTINDLQLPNGFYIPNNSSLVDIHTKFGMAWSTTANTSLFTYPTGLSWSDYQNTAFLPSFATPPDNPACNGDHDCNYDAANTGNIDVALSNVQVKERVSEIKRSNEEVSKYCPMVEGIANGQVTVEITSASRVSYSVKCNKGFKLQGKEKVTCIDGQYEAIGVCASAYKILPFTSTMIAIVLAANVLRHMMHAD